MELNLCCFPNTAFHVPSFHGQDTGVIKLDVMTHVNGELCHSQFIQMAKSDVPMAFSDPDLNGKPNLPHSQRMLHMPGVFKPRTSLIGQRKLEPS
jgi:hypothetical protein